MAVDPRSDKRFIHYSDVEQQFLAQQFVHEPKLGDRFLEFLDIPDDGSRTHHAQKIISLCRAEKLERSGFSKAGMLLQPAYALHVFHQTPAGIDKAMAIKMFALRQLPEALTTGCRIADTAMPQVKALAMEAIAGFAPGASLTYSLYDEYVKQESRMAHWVNDVDILDNLNQLLMQSAVKPMFLKHYMEALREAPRQLKTTTGVNLMLEMRQHEKKLLAQYRDTLAPCAGPESARS